MLASALVALAAGAQGQVSDAVDAAGAVPRDTLIPHGIAYAGYRLHVRNVSVVRRRGRGYELRCEIVNTGRRPIALGPGFPTRYLQTAFDHTLALGGLLPLGEPIRAAIVEARGDYPLGAWVKGVELYVEPDDRIAAAPVALDTFTRQRARVRRRPPGAVNRDPGEGTAGDTQKQTESITQTACADLAVEGVRVVFRERNAATVQIALAVGEGASLSYADLPAGLALHLYLSGTPDLTPSARRLGVIDLPTRLGKREGQALVAGERVTLVERLDTSAATRYTGIVIAQLDPGQALAECREDNNLAHVALFD